MKLAEQILHESEQLHHAAQFMKDHGAKRVKNAQGVFYEIVDKSAADRTLLIKALDALDKDKSFEYEDGFYYSKKDKSFIVDNPRNNKGYSELSTAL
jgi:hypothetical protein